MKVFYREGRDPKPLFADMEAEFDIEYVPVDEHGNVLVETTIKAGETIYILGNKAFEGAEEKKFLTPPSFL